MNCPQNVHKKEGKKDVTKSQDDFYCGVLVGSIIGFLIALTPKLTEFLVKSWK